MFYLMKRKELITTLIEKARITVAGIKGGKEEASAILISPVFPDRRDKGDFKISISAIFSAICSVVEGESKLREAEIFPLTWQFHFQTPSSVWREKFS